MATWSSLLNTIGSDSVLNVYVRYFLDIERYGVLQKLSTGFYWWSYQTIG